MGNIRILLIWKDANSISCIRSQAFDGFLDGPDEKGLERLVVQEDFV